MSNSFVYPAGDLALRNGTITISQLKIMLVDATYVADAADLFVDEAGANDPIDAEITATNYTGGHGGAGRKSLANEAWAGDNARLVNRLQCDDLVWTSLGGAANDTIAAAIVIAEDGSDDDGSILVSYLKRISFTTTGANFTWSFSVDGVISHLYQAGLAAVR